MSTSSSDLAGKAGLRADAFSRRQRRTADDLAGRSARLAGHLLADPRWGAAAAVAAFVGVRGEPDTRPILAAALAAGKRLWLPRMTGPRRRDMEFVALVDLADLVLAPFGLLEPRGGVGTSLAEADVDLVVVPGLAFSPGGVRLGFGKAHYDRALAPLRDRPRPLRVGLCLREDVVHAGLPEEPHDVRVHALLTEDGMNDCTGP